MVVRQRKVALHTSSHLTPTEAWRSPDSTSLEGHRVSSEVWLGNCTQVWGVCQIWRAWDSWLRKNSSSHLFWLVQTCPDLRTIQWPCTLVSRCHFLHFRSLLFFSLTPYPCLKAIDRKSFERGNFLVLHPLLLKMPCFKSANWQLSIDVQPKELRQKKIVDPSRATP